MDNWTYAIVRELLQSYVDRYVTEVFNVLALYSIYEQN